MNPVNQKYDVVIVGAGPVGISTACTLKAINKDLKICVLDKRDPDGPRRTHKLQVLSDSVSEIHRVLSENQSESTADSRAIDRLKETYKKWKGRAISTNTIEDDLAKIAADSGITVLRGEQYAVTKESFDDLISQEEEIKVEGENRALRPFFKHAKVVIGADGASDSVVREKIMGGKLVDEKTLQYLVEFKFKVEGDPKELGRGLLKASTDGSFRKDIDFETIGKGGGTLHKFVDQSTHEALKAFGKGTFKNPWSMEELDIESVNHSGIREVNEHFKDYQATILKRGGKFTEEKITTIPMKVFRSEKSVAVKDGKAFALVGDANSGLIFVRGFNKGLREAALCAQAVSDVFKQNQNQKFSAVPGQLSKYQTQVQKLYANEKWWAEFKNVWINVARYALKFFFGPLVWCFKPLRSVYLNASESLKARSLNVVSEHVFSANQHWKIPSKYDSYDADNFEVVSV